MSLDKQALFWLAATVGGYLLSRQLYRRVKWYWLSPIVFVPVLLYALAIPTHTRYADYARDTNWLVALLGPATVAFAIPIWQQRELLMRHWPALLAGMFAGTAVAIGSSWALAQALALDGQVTLSLLPRSITTPFAMEMSHDLGGVPELTAAFVMITGVFGAVIGGTLLRVLRLRTPLARGALFGVGAHGAGTSSAIQPARECKPGDSRRRRAGLDCGHPITTKEDAAVTAVHSLPADVQAQVSAAEWQTRVDLAACYRLVALHGWDDLIFTHISAKVPGTEDFLINPFGLMFHEITASSLVKVDASGKKLMDSPYEINPAGYTIHSAVHEVRHDVECVLHTHTAAGIAVSCQKQGLLPLSQQSLFVLSSLSYHAYEGVALNHEEKARLQADLGASNFLILPNHGLLTCGGSIADTFLMMFTLQRACEVQVMAQSGGAELIHIPGQILAGARDMIAGVMRSKTGMGGQLAWPALLRKLDQQNPGYRQ